MSLVLIVSWLRVCLIVVSWYIPIIPIRAIAPKSIIRMIVLLIGFVLFGLSIVCISLVSLIDSGLLWFVGFWLPIDNFIKIADISVFEYSIGIR